jgi:transcriptional regulator with XRE-family HTH domain
MASSPLLLQIKDRTTAFLKNTGISQAQLCRYLAIDHSSLSQFLSGTKGLDPSVVIRLCQTLSLSHREVAAKFSEPVRSSRILNLQQSIAGLPAQMRLDGNDEGSWVPGLSGTDPNDSGNTIVDPTDDTLDTLRRVRAIHRKAIRAINDFINQAKINRQGTTPPTAQKFSR